MKLTSSQREAADSIAREEWHFLTRRADVPVMPVVHKLVCTGGDPAFRRIYGTNVRCLAFWNNGTLEYYLYGRDFAKAIKSSTELFLSPRKFVAYSSELKRLCLRAKQKARVFKDRKISLGNEALLSKYDEIIDAYCRSFVYGFNTWCSQILQNIAKDIIKKHLPRAPHFGLSEETALNILISHGHKTVYNQRDDALESIFQRHRTTILKSLRSGAAGIKKKAPKLTAAIESFLSAYEWVSYDYNGPALSLSETWKMLREKTAPTDTDKKLPTRARLAAELRLSRKEKDVIRSLSVVSHFKDIRNTTDDYVHFCLDNFYRETARRSGIAKSRIKFLWPHELATLLKHGGDKGSRKAGNAEPRLLVIGKVPSFYKGQEAITRKNRMVAKKTAIERKGSQIKGNVAAVGRVEGKVKLVYSYRDIKKVKRGDILVTYMTSPRLMPALLKCGAIVTNDGGLTCHAAIIARELKKPCVIGTKIATEVLSDGDFVEVDANKGVISIIRRNK